MCDRYLHLLGCMCGWMEGWMDSRACNNLTYQLADDVVVNCCVLVLSFGGAKQFGGGKLYLNLG